MKIIILSLLAALLLVGSSFLPVSGSPNDHLLIPRDYTNGAPIAKPLPESEMITILFSKDWINKYDLDPNPEIVSISISESELSNNFPLSKDFVNRQVDKGLNLDDEVIMLRMPLTLFDRLNVDEKGLNVTLPVSHFFRSFRNSGTIDAILNGTELAEVADSDDSYSYENSEREGSLLNEPLIGWHYEWITLLRNNPWPYPEYHINYLIGQTTPSIWTHVSTDRWDIYQEREIYMRSGNDAIEITVNYNDNVEYGRILLFPAFWDNGVQVPIEQWESQGAGLIEIPPGSLPHSFGYHVQTGNSRYYVTFEDMNTLYWYPTYVYYDPDPTYYFDELKGSSELWVETGFSGDIHAWTSPVRDEWNYDISRGQWLRPRTVWQIVEWTPEMDFVDIVVSWMGTNYDELATWSYCNSH